MRIEADTKAKTALVRARFFVLVAFEAAIDIVVTCWA